MVKGMEGMRMEGMRMEEWGWRNEDGRMRMDG